MSALSLAAAVDTLLCESDVGGAEGEDEDGEGGAVYEVESVGEGVPSQTHRVLQLLLDLSIDEVWRLGTTLNWDAIRITRGTSIME